MPVGRQPQSVIHLPAVLTTGAGGGQPRYILDVDAGGDLVVQDKDGNVIVRFRSDGQVDAHLTFNDAGV